MSSGSGFVEVDGGRLRYEVDGEGPGVALLHPGLWDMRTWDGQFGVLVDAGYRVLRYDLRGYGASTRPSDEPYSHVRDLIRVLDAVDMRRPALVGCSMGGEVTIDAALAHPDRVAALVLVAPGLGGFEPTPDEEAWWDARTRDIEPAVRAGDLDRAQDLRLAIWASLGTGDPRGRRIREIAFENLHELTMDESAYDDPVPPAVERLEEISVSTLVLPAEHDPPHMGRLADLVGSRIAGARVVRIEGTDHVVNMRRPEEFNDVVLGFLNDALS
jgi:pimeloyl-ACP methyl ester carboxylesterase